MGLRGRLYFILLVLVFVINSIFSQIDTDSWQFEFFFTTMGSQALLSFAGVLGVVILSITAKFPPEYLKTHLVGNGLSGLVTSTMRLISIMVSPSVTGNSIDIPYIIFPNDDLEKRKGSLGAFSQVKGPYFASQSLHPWDDQPDPNAPIDRFNFVRISLFILGFTGMLPMIMLITANEYWMYKFRDVNVPWEHYSASNRTQLQVNFASYHMMASIAPSVIFNFISTFIGHKVRMNVRARIHFIMLVAVFVMNTAFTQINTDSWQLGFFLLTMGSQVILSFASALGIVILPITTKFPKKYLQTHLVGGGVTGIVTAVLRLISITASPDLTSSALIYFGTGTALMLLSAILFDLMKLSKYYQFYVTSCEEAETKKEVNSFSTVLGAAKKVWPIILLNSVGIIIPTSCISTLVVSEGQGNGSLWSDKYFVTTATYFIPAIAAIMGRLWSNRHLHLLNGKFLALSTILKLLIFTPLIYLSNAQPRHHLPVLLKHDWEYMLMVFIHSFAEGFLMNLNMFWTTSLVPHDKIELGFRVVMMVMGAMGSLSSPLSVLAVKII